MALSVRVERFKDPSFGRERKGKERKGKGKECRGEEMAEEVQIEEGVGRTVKDLVSGAAGGIAQVLIGMS